MNARRLAARAKHFPRDASRWLSIVRSTPAADEVRVYYGRDRVPLRDELTHGGAIKLQTLTDAFPNAPRDFNVLYLVSSAWADDAGMLVRLARRRGARVVVNQNGVAYQAWHGPGYERVNAPRARILHAARHVVYQSEFCKLSADRFYGERQGSWEVLHNPVATGRFTPASRVATARLTLLLGGSQYQSYCVQRALATLARLPDRFHLIVTGELTWHPDRNRCRREAAALMRAHGLDGRVEFTGPYRQQDAPDLFRRADILLHTKYNDPCPTIVLEAMACGLPVAYSASGGTPELVGPDAGIGIPAPLDWDRDHPPDPAHLAAAVEELGTRLGDFAAAARARAELFDAQPWLERHRDLFEELVR